MQFLSLLALLGLIPPLTDLEATLAAAHAAEKPLIIYVSRSDCTFCKAFEHEVLGPLVNAGVFDGRVLFRELMMDADSDTAALAARLEVHVTPTILFLRGDGRETSRRMLGYTRNDFYSYYLERAIEHAIRQTAEDGILARDELTR